MTRKLIHRPRRRVNSESSVCWSIQVAPPGLREPGSRDLLFSLTCSKPNSAKTCLNLVRSVCPDFAHKRWWGWRREKARCVTWRRSGMSSLALWCLAAVNLVLGSFSDKSAKLFVKFVSQGNKRSFRIACRNSPTRNRAPQDNANIPATSSHPM